MATSTLTQIAAQKTALDQQFLSRASITWLQKRMASLKSPTKLAREIVSEKNRNGTFEVGGLYHFFYDPLTKNKLPYYDTFPLIIPLRIDKDGFLALNLHYLPPMYRATFLDKLMPLALKNERNDPTRLRVTYDILKITQSVKEFKPCLKKYLESQIRSRIVPVEPNEWEVALFLPTAIFKGATEKKVYAESLKEIRTG
jgi:hypothetical protein